MTATVRAITTAKPNSVGSFNVTKPTGTAQGDLLLAFHSMDQGTLAQMGTPTGGATWLSLGTRNSGTGYDMKTKLWWKIAGASEPANYGFTENSTGTGCVAIVAIMGADTTVTPVVAQAGSDAGFEVTVATPSSTPTGSDDLELRWAAGNPDFEAVTWTAPATYTKQADLQGNNTTACLATKQLTSSAATGVQNFTASVGVGNRHGFTVDVASLPDQPPRPPVIVSQAVNRSSRW
ncbi:hypothetical protein ACIBCT_21265 [Streptosporangium sp. NPDC050855]|uniref:hypothetical protein n=1 Tax=Streptosporangium sp. NPDC050855 TaxID=3366194 RepID=UPI0037BB57E7